MDPDRWARVKSDVLAHADSLDSGQPGLQSGWRTVLDSEIDRHAGGGVALSCRSMSWGPSTSAEDPDLLASTNDAPRFLLRPGLDGIVSYLGGGLTLEVEQAHVLKSVPLRPALGGAPAGPAQGWHHHSYWSCILAVEKGTAVDFAVLEDGLVGARTVAIPLGHAIVFPPGMRHRGLGYAQRHIRVQAALDANSGRSRALCSENLSLIHI